MFFSGKKLKFRSLRFRHQRKLSLLLQKSCRELINYHFYCSFGLVNRKSFFISYKNWILHTIRLSIPKNDFGFFLAFQPCLSIWTQFLLGKCLLFHRRPGLEVLSLIAPGSSLAVNETTWGPVRVGEDFHKHFKISPWRTCLLWRNVLSVTIIGLLAFWVKKSPVSYSIQVSKLFRRNQHFECLQNEPIVNYVKQWTLSVPKQHPASRYSLKMRMFLHCLRS